MAEDKSTMTDERLDGPGAASATRALPPDHDRPAAVSEEDIALVEQSLAALMSDGARLAPRFYQRLFARHPEIEPLFEHVSMPGQQKKLLASLMLIARNLRQPAVLADYVATLGERHHGYGIPPQDFVRFSDCLLVVMEESPDTDWDGNTSSAWRRVLDAVSALMREAPAGMKAPTSQADWLHALLDAVPTPLMALCPDGRLRHHNAAMRTLLDEIGLSAHGVEQLHGRPLAELLHKLGCGRAPVFGSHPDEYEIALPAGAYRLVSRPVQDAQDGTVGLMLEWHPCPQRPAEGEQRAPGEAARQLAYHAGRTGLMAARVAQEVGKLRLLVRQRLAQAATADADLSGQIAQLAFRIDLASLNLAVEATRQHGNDGALPLLASELRALAKALDSLVNGKPRHRDAEDSARIDSQIEAACDGLETEVGALVDGLAELGVSDAALSGMDDAALRRARLQLLALLDRA